MAGKERRRWAARGKVAQSDREEKPEKGEKK